MNTKAWSGFYHSWISLLHGLKTDLEGLERTIEQSTTDKIVYEEEQVRAEQEMIGELELLRQREGAGEDGGDSSVEALLAAVALILGLSSFDIFNRFRDWDYLWLIPLILIASISLYLAFFSAGKWARRRIRESRWSKQPDGKFYYKADLRLELRLSKEGALLLFGNHVGTPEQGQNDPLIERLDEPRHSSYRIERSSKDTSVQKIHLERALVWKKGSRPKRRLPFLQRGNEDKMLVHLIYEIVFNRLVSPEEFVLYELRTVAIHGRPLEPDELVAFRRLIGDFFVNRLLAEGEKRLELESDALLALPTK